MTRFIFHIVDGFRYFIFYMQRQFGCKGPEDKFYKTEEYFK